MMKIPETKNKAMFNFSILLHSLKAASFQLIWPIGGIGLPAIYFGYEGNFLEMALLFIICFSLIVGLYTLACVIVTKIRLSDKAVADEFLLLSDEEKGKQIADTLVGW